jgi:hypothetical protein
LPIAFLFPRRSLFILLCLALLAAACGGDSTPAPTATPADTATPVPTSTPAPTPTPEPKRPEASAFPPNLELRAQGILQEIARLRGTPQKGNVEKFLLNRAQARAYYSEDPPANPQAGGSRPLDAKNELYKLLGLVPDRADTNVQQQSVDNLISLITGFYSAELKAFYMLDEITGGVLGGSATATIAHEFVHALQDQYYDINAIAARIEDDWDATRAFQDVLEGDALYFEEQYLGYSLRSTYRVPVCFTIPQPARSVPFIIERELDTWYEDGLCFVRAVLPQLPGGIASVWEHLPSTTEQVLHPEKYIAGEGAKPVTLQPIDAALGEGWTKLAQHNFGEFTLQNLLVAGLASNRPLVQRAAAGWGGDAWSLYVQDDARLMQSTIVWDSEAEAREFWDALVTSLYNRGSGRQPPIGEDRLSLDLADRTWRGAIAGDRVTLLVSNDPAALDRVAMRLAMP